MQNVIFVVPPTPDIESYGRLHFDTRLDEESTSYQLDNIDADDYLHRPSYRPFTFRSLFQRGRDVQSAGVNHVYTREERQRLSDIESIDYLPVNSQTYRVWLAQQPHG